MKPRDLAIVAAVVLVGGFAVADALRSSGEKSTAPATQSVLERRDGPEPQADAPKEWPAGRLRGTLVFTDARDCRLRVIGLGGGRERPAGDLVGFCREWVAPVGQRVVYNTGGVRGSAGESFAVVDLRRAGVELASIQTLGPGGDVLWSPDAQRVAWCTPNGVGKELELGAERPRSFARCPIAYSSDGQLVFAVGRKLVSEGRTIVVEEDPIVQAHWGQDESLLVVLAGGVVRRYAGAGGLVGVQEISLPEAHGITPSPDNCAVAFFDAGRIRVEDAGCFRAPARAFIGLDVSWSADGFWIAVAAPDQIEFHRVLGGEETIVWPARARELYWRDD
jgi:hypothetical protein